MKSEDLGDGTAKRGNRWQLLPCFRRCWPYKSCFSHFPKWLADGHQMCRVAMSYNADQEMEAEEVKAESNACESLQLGW